MYSINPKGSTSMSKQRVIVNKPTKEKNAITKKNTQSRRRGRKEQKIEETNKKWIARWNIYTKQYQYH